jgi:hypothetical protein
VAVVRDDAAAGRREKRAPPPAPSRTTFSARAAPKPGSDSQGKSGLRKITRNLSPDLATFGWTGHNGLRAPCTGRQRGQGLFQPVLAQPICRFNPFLVSCAI